MLYVRRNSHAKLLLVCSRQFSVYGALVAVWYRVPDLQSGGCRFASQPGLLHAKVYSAFNPFGVSK